MVVTQGGQRQSAIGGFSRELVNVRDRPPPRRLVHEIPEAGHRRRAVLDGLLTEPSRQLLIPPAVHHRVEDLLLRVRQSDVRRRGDQSKCSWSAPKILH